jgi:hypothetical protein
MNQEAEILKIKLAALLPKIERLERQINGGYTAQVAKSFHLGMVGGSGRNTHRLNKRRSSEIDKTIDNAILSVQLCKERDALIYNIEYIESGRRDKDLKDRTNQKEKLKIGLVQYWNGLKAGDLIDIGGNSKVQITRKNKKSIETGAGCKWSAAEIIGKEAANLI